MYRLEPILQRIKDKRNAVVCPVIDMISDDSMAYLGGAAGGIGTFWWSLHFKMDPMPERERKRRKNSQTDPIMLVFDSDLHCSFKYRQLQVADNGGRSPSGESGILFRSRRLRSGYGHLGRREPGNFVQGRINPVRLDNVDGLFQGLDVRRFDRVSSLLACRTHFSIRSSVQYDWTARGRRSRHELETSRRSVDGRL